MDHRRGLRALAKRVVQASKQYRCWLTKRECSGKPIETLYKEGTNQAPRGDHNQKSTEVRNCPVQVTATCYFVLRKRGASLSRLSEAANQIAAPELDGLQRAPSSKKSSTECEWKRGRDIRSVLEMAAKSALTRKGLLMEVALDQARSLGVLEHNGRSGSGVRPPRAG